MGDKDLKEALRDAAKFYLSVWTLTLIAHVVINSIFGPASSHEENLLRMFGLPFFFSFVVFCVQVKVNIKNKIPEDPFGKSEDPKEHREVILSFLDSASELGGRGSETEKCVRWILFQDLCTEYYNEASLVVEEGDNTPVLSFKCPIDFRGRYTKKARSLK